LLPKVLIRFRYERKKRGKGGGGKSTALAVLKDTFGRLHVGEKMSLAITPKLRLEEKKKKKRRTVPSFNPQPRENKREEGEEADLKPPRICGSARKKGTLKPTERENRARHIIIGKRKKNQRHHQEGGSY